MAASQIWTYKDLVDHLIDWLGANPSSEARRDARGAALNALRELTSEHQWSYYYQLGRVNTVAPYSTGTVEYDHTGGTYERQLTLTSGTWPTWSSQGTVILNNITYEVAARKSATVLTLAVHNNPGADVAAGTSYNIYQDSYPLPTDFQSLGQMVITGYDFFLTFERPGDLLQRRRIYRGQAMPRSYTVQGSPDFMNTMQVVYYPPPDAIYAMDFVYKRRPRGLSIEDHHTGKVTTTADSATVTGTGTAWASRHVGTMFRVSRTTELPTSPFGDNQPVCSRIVTAVNSATSITLDDTVPESLSSAPYVLSDPIDVEDGCMLTALLRCAEFQLAHKRRTTERELLERYWMQALIKARETDSRSFADSQAGPQAGWPTRLANYPRGADVP